MSPHARPAERSSLILRGRGFAWGSRTYVMAIVNASPDSFSGDGLGSAEAAAQAARAQALAGAHIVDIGGQSTRPGHVAVNADEERRRVLPAIERARELLPETPISIDTYRPSLLREGVAAGADLLNSVQGLDGELLEAAASSGVPVVIMHNGRGAVYERGIVDEVLSSLDAQARRAVGAGIPAQAVILDPGIGFGKTPDQNLELLRELPRLVALGFPTLIGTSRKSTIGKLTGRPVGDRAFGTAATLALAAAAGVDIVRVHDVSAALDVLAVADAIGRDWRPEGWNLPDT